MKKETVDVFEGKTKTKHFCEKKYLGQLFSKHMKNESNRKDKTKKHMEA